MGTLPGSMQHLGPTQLGPRSWDQEELKVTPAQQVYSRDDHSHGLGLYLRTNQIKQIWGLIIYMKHVFGSYKSGISPQDDPFHPFTTDE